MRRLAAIYALLFLFCICASAQKKVIGNDAIESWPTLHPINPDNIGIISSFGNYYSYAFSAKSNEDTVIIASIDNSFIIKKAVKEYYKGDRVQFSGDERYAGVIFSGDSLAIYNLKTAERIFLSGNIEWFKFVGDPAAILILFKTTKDEAISLYSLSDRKTKCYQGFTNYVLSANNKYIIMKSSRKVVLLQIDGNKQSLLFSGDNLQAFTADPKTLNVYILTQSDTSFQIFYHQNRTGQTKLVLSSESPEIPLGHKVVPLDFEEIGNGGSLLFKMEEMAAPLFSANDKPKSTFKLWHYSDRFIDTDNHVRPTRTLVYNPCIDTLFYLFDDSELPWLDISGIRRNGKIVTYSKVNDRDFDWSDEQIEIKVHDINTGEQDKVCDMPKSINPLLMYVSPNGRFVMWWDSKKRRYFSYEVASKRIRACNLDTTSMFDDFENEIPQRRLPFGVAAWGSGDSCIYIYSKFDVWKLDTYGTWNVSNITNNEGFINNVKLRLVNPKDMELQQPILLSAFDVKSKMNGFVVLDVNRSFKLQLKNLGPYCYRDNNSFDASGYQVSTYIPVKASSKQVYLVRRESSVESPNLFVTSDFRRYKQLTFIAPERTYKWYKSRLVEWSVPGHTVQQGILYFPEDLDTTKKYPVICSYYEKKSDELFVYKFPKLSYGDLSIPWYTSHDFAVFVPDIITVTGDIKRSVINTLSLAIDALGEIDWIDTSMIGIQGHSHGGYETYLASTSSKFKAAQVSAGFSDLATFYSYIFVNGTRQSFVQFGQTNIGGTPWDNQSVYTSNSPLYIASSVKVPVLIMHPRYDNVVPVSHGMNMFTALRRLKKKVWLLMYENDGHTLRSPINQLDFTIKQQEYFSYFLKSGVKPFWLDRQSTN